MEFRCGNNSSTSERWFACQNGGICNYDATRGEFCGCPEGWTNDYVGFAHLPNCSLPESLLTIFFAVYSAVYWVTMIVSGYATRTKALKGKMRTLSTSTHIWSFTTWIHLLCVFIQGGFFEAALVSFAIVGVVGYWIASFTIAMLLVPIAKRAGLSWFAEMVPKFAWTAFTFQTCLTIALTGMAIHHNRDVNPANFNKYMIVNLAEQSIAVLTGCSLMFGVILKLRKVLPESAVFVRRQISVIAMSAQLLGGGGVAVMCVVGVWVAFGSVAYLWIIWLIMHLLLWIIIIFQLPLARSLELQSQQETNGTLRIKIDPDGEGSTNSSSNIASSPTAQVIGLGISGKAAGKWRKKNSRGPTKPLTRVTEIEEEKAASTG